MEPRIPARNPDAYTIGVPQLYFSPIPGSGNLDMWADWRALAHAAFGTTNAGGKVVNTKGNAVGTPQEVFDSYYMGTLDGVNVGGDVETLEHTIANLGYEELDRMVVLQRPLQYGLSFEEPDVKNLTRYFVGQESDLGLALEVIEVTGETFQGSGSQAVTIVDRRIGDPSKALESIVALWQSNGGGETMPPNGVYGFIVGGTNEDPCVGDWEFRRQWLAYATFDFAAGTVGAWAYLRPQGTAEDNAYGGDTLFKTNNVIHSIPDSSPMLNKCEGSIDWNVNANLAWNGYMWVRSDEGFYGYGVIGTRTSFKRTFGCAIIFTLTQIGTSMVHVIPKCSLMPDGTMAFNSDSWMQGSFQMQCLRDNSAVFADRTPALPIPFGYVQTFAMPSSE